MESKSIEVIKRKISRLEKELEQAKRQLVVAEKEGPHVRWLKIVDMKENEGLTYKAIAERLNRHPNTIVRLYRLGKKFIQNNTKNGG